MKKTITALLLCIITTFASASEFCGKVEKIAKYKKVNSSGDQIASTSTYQLLVDEKWPDLDKVYVAPMNDEVERALEGASKYRLDENEGKICITGALVTVETQLNIGLAAPVSTLFGRIVRSK